MEEYCDKINILLESTRNEVNLSKESIDDKNVMEIIEALILNDEDIKEDHHSIKIKIANYIFNSIRKDLGILDQLAKDEKISEIMVNGKSKIFIDRNGSIEKTDLFFHKTEELEELIRRLASKVQKEINELNPILDARLYDGSRVNAVYKNISPGGPVLTIRKFPQKAIDMSKLIELNTITLEAAKFLKTLVMSGYNIFISGGTSSGKTTFLNVLSNYIPSNERIVVIEDTAELQILNIENIVRMECRNANIQGKGQIDMRDLIKTSLRMRPDRIIVGEVRGGEVMDMIQAMNTGHDGSLSTGHGNSPEGMLHRLEAMFLQAVNYPVEAIRSQIAEGIDIIVHLGKVKNNKRVILKIVEIDGIIDNQIRLNVLYEYSPDKGLVKTNLKLKNTYKMHNKEFNYDN